MKEILILLFSVAVIAAVPLALIGSLNTLFPALAISYGFLEWLSALFIILWFSNQNTKGDSVCLKL